MNTLLAIALLAAGGVPGTDVSNWSGDVDWSASSAKFAYVHATEGLDYKSPRFAGQFSGALDAGLYRGAYHFAQPHESSGAAQADFFVRNGGRWIWDGKTLPGVLDIEDNPYGKTNKKDHCYGLDQEEMTAWIGDFLKRYKARTRRDAVIYTTTAWWISCTGDTTRFKANPLWIAKWGASPGALPAAWKKHTFWQSAEKGLHAGGTDSYLGSNKSLALLALPPAKATITGKGVRRKAYSLTIVNTGARPLTKLSIYGKAYGANKFVKAPKACTRTAASVRCSVSVLPGKTVKLTFATRPKGTAPVGVRFRVGASRIVRVPG